MNTDAPRDRSSSVKLAIREAAAMLFARDGYGATGIRDIAAQAGTDPALLIRHFGSKQALFLETMRVDVSFDNVLAGPVEDLATRLLGYLLSDAGTDSIRGVFVALTRASDQPEVQVQLQASIHRTFTAPIAARLTAPQAQLRARLFSAQIGGLMSALWINQDPLLVDTAPAEIVAVYGESMQQLLTP